MTEPPYRDLAARAAPRVLDLAVTVCRIPAPTFEEARRAAFVRERFEALGLAPWTDDAGNVFARRAGRGRGVVLVSAHTDTVFPAGTDLTVRREPGRLVGPGIGDNSLAVAALLELPSLLDEAGIVTGPDLLLCANTCEEGLGNLAGMRRAVADHRDELCAAIPLEGLGLGRVVHRAVGSRRLRVTVEGPGGHSWGAFGAPSAIHVLGEIITAIARLSVPTEPRTTFNVGQIEGGVSINTIAPTASLTLDLRSVDPAALDALVGQVDAIVSGANDGDRGITVASEVIGDRPAGDQPEDLPLVRLACAVLREVGVEPRLEAGSTDANAPIAQEIPAVCVGLTTGGNSHRVDEYLDTETLPAGLQALLLLLARIDDACPLP